MRANRPAILAAACATALLAVAQAAPVAGFRPADGNTVVLVLGDRTAERQLTRLRTAVDRNPGDPELVVSYATALIETGHRSGTERYYGWAENLLRPYAATSSDPRILLRYADMLQYRHEFASSEGVLTRVLSRQPDDGTARLARAQARLALGNARGAVGDCLLAARSIDPLAASACMAQAEGMLGDPGPALELVQQALNSVTATDDVRSYASGIAAELAGKTGQPKLAERWYLEALRTAGWRHYPALAYADFLIASNRPAEALTVLASRPATQPIRERREKALAALAQAAAPEHPA
jgi:tetratricopeptide (TPR) repeat protein